MFQRGAWSQRLFVGHTIHSISLHSTQALSSLWWNVSCLLQRGAWSQRLCAGHIILDISLHSTKSLSRLFVKDISCMFQEEVMKPKPGCGSCDGYANFDSIIMRIHVHSTYVIDMAHTQTYIHTHTHLRSWQEQLAARNLHWKGVPPAAYWHHFWLKWSICYGRLCWKRASHRGMHVHASFLSVYMHACSEKDTPCMCTCVHVQKMILHACIHACMYTCMHVQKIIPHALHLYKHYCRLQTNSDFLNDFWVVNWYQNPLKIVELVSIILQSAVPASLRSAHAHVHVQVMKRTLDPVWGQIFVYELVDPLRRGCGKIAFRVMDWDRLTKDDMIGWVEVSMMTYHRCLRIRIYIYIYICIYIYIYDVHYHRWLRLCVCVYIYIYIYIYIHVPTPY